MKIGILGAPGTEKSKLARALAKEFEHTNVVDNYVQRLRKKTGLALGPWATYHENFMIAGARLADEYRAAQDAYTIVTVGTIMDTITYAAVKTDVALHKGESAARALYTMAQGAMQGFSVLYTETWDYNLAFLLPYSDKQKREMQGTWELALDQGYRYVLESYDVPFIYELGGTTTDRIKIAKDVINAARKAPDEAEAAASVQ